MYLMQPKYCNTQTSHMCSFYLSVPYRLCLLFSLELELIIFNKHSKDVTTLSLHTSIGCGGNSPRSNMTGLCSPVHNVSDYRCVSDYRSRGREFDPSPVPYFRGDWSWNDFYGHSLNFRWFIQEGLLSITSESMCTKYWLTTCSSLPRKKVWLGELTFQPWP